MINSFAKVPAMPGENRKSYAIVFNKKAPCLKIGRGCTRIAAAERAIEMSQISMLEPHQLKQVYDLG